MELNLQVFHMEARGSIPEGLNRHITREYYETIGESRVLRVWVPDNADPEKTGLNQELIPLEYKDSKGKRHQLTIQQAVDRRLRAAGIKPRLGQNTSLEIILSGSHEVMSLMSPEIIQNWAEDSVKWAQKVFGKDNVVCAMLHLDEKTPHIHMVVVPIVNGQSRRTKRLQKSLREAGKEARAYKIDHEKLRLCANEVFTRKKLYFYHDDYFKDVGGKYGLMRGIRAEPGSKKKHIDSAEYNRNLEREKAEIEKSIKELKVDYNTIDSQKRKSEQELMKNNSILQGHEIKIAEQEKTIATNKETIQKQEEQKSSTVIIDDAADKILMEKRKAIAEIKAEKTRIAHDIVLMKTEFNELDAAVKTRRKQLLSQATHWEFPKKNALGVYKTSEVDNFLETIHIARLLKEMSNVPNDITVDQDIKKELERLQKVEALYKALYQSPDLLMKRCNEIETAKKRFQISKVLEYVFEKKVNVQNFSINLTDKGEEIFSKFSFGGESTLYSAYISPEKSVTYTHEDLHSLEEAKERFKDSIWFKMGKLSEIRKKKEREDTLSRYSTKLSNLLDKEIRITDYEKKDKCILLFSHNGTKYYVNMEGTTWSTDDKRVNSISNLRKYLNDSRWFNHGNINKPARNNGRKMSR